MIATGEDLTNMLDYASEDIDDMDDNAEDESSQVPPVMGRWTATSTYDVYMVDTPKNDEDNRIHMRIDPSVSHQSTDVSGVALNRVGRRIVIPAPETIELRTAPKISNTLSIPHLNRTSGKKVNTALDALTTKTRRTSTTCQNP